MAGPSASLDPAVHAHRKDLADVALAGQVIASHYVEPVARRMGTGATVREAPSSDAAPVGEIDAGEPFLMLDDSLGWAWGYAGKDQKVGYVPSDSLTG